MTPSARAVLVLLAAALPVAAHAVDECGERARLDAILNVDPSVWYPQAGGEDDPLAQMYDIVGPWAVAVALGDYAGAELLADEVLPRMDQLFAWVDAAADPSRPETLYVRTVVSGTLARIALVDHRLLRALRHGLIARDDARRLAEHDPDDPRPGFFLGLYDYYTGVAPGWVRAVGKLAGIDGDVERGIERLEAAVASGQALAPEAARVLLEETRPRDRPACRYLPLARELAARYPDNYRFRFYVERELARCPGDGSGAAGAPRLGAGCPTPEAGSISSTP